jgi:RNA polymerase sigma-70 factor (ECF subfamily)
MTTEEEKMLVTEAQNGSQKAIGLLWDSITPKLYGYLVNVLRDKNLAEDILQNTWTKAIQSLSKYEYRNIRFSAWLFAIAKNECRQHWRSTKPEEPLDSVEKKLSYTSVQNDSNLMIDYIMKILPENDQELLRLRYIADLSFKEIAKILRITPITARVRIHRSLARARNILKKESL